MTVRPRALPKLRDDVILRYSAACQGERAQRTTRSILFGSSPATCTFNSQSVGQFKFCGNDKQKAWSHIELVCALACVSSVAHVPTVLLFGIDQYSLLVREF